MGKIRKKNRPYFIWDYDLSEEDVRRILKSGDENTRLWLITRILESAKYDDVWKYLTLKEILKVFPQLRLKKPIKEAWENAFKAWRVHYDPHTASK